MTNNILSIDEAKFKKTSKKLLNKLQEIPLNEIKDIKLTQVQEILAQSLGFRNMFDLQKNIFTNENDFKPNNFPVDLSHVPEQFHDIWKNGSGYFPKLFYSMNHEQSLNMIVNLMEFSADMWRGRAISLINAILLALFYMRDEQEILLDSTVICEYLIFDNIIKLYQNRRDLPNNIRAALRAYLISLPGFQESALKQNDVVMEQHGYLQMQFASVFDKLIKIEKNDFIIADYNWFVLGYKDVVIGTHGSSQTEGVNITDNHKVFSLNPKLESLDFLDDSWLSIEQYSSWIQSLYEKNKLTTLKVSDLIIYITNIVAPNKKESMKLLLDSIVYNYSTASKMSSDIIKALK